MPLHGVRQSKPGPGSSIDWGQPLSQGLDLCLAMAEGAGQVAVDAVRQCDTAFNGSGSMSWSASPLGSSPTFPSTGYWTIAGPGQYTSQDFSLSFWFLESAATSTVLFGTGQFATSGWYLQANNSSDQLTITTNQSGAGQQNSSGSHLSVGSWQHWVVVRSGTVISWYLDGAQVTGGASASVIDPTLGGNLYINNYPGLGFSAASSLDAVMFWGGVAISQPQAASLYANTWQVFGAPRSYFLYNHHAIAPTYMPWIFGDQIESNGGG